MLKEEKLQIGQVVYSCAGRDAGRYYVVYQILNEQYVSLVDGVHRLLERPKKKKIRHIEAKMECFSSLAEKLNSGQQIFDAEIRNFLQAAGYKDKQSQREA